MVKSVGLDSCPYPLFHVLICILRCREEARRQFQASPFFSAWDSDVLETYIECGLTQNGNGGVKLKTSGFQVRICTLDPLLRSAHVWMLFISLSSLLIRDMTSSKLQGSNCLAFQEGVVFNEPYVPFEVYSLLPKLDQRIDLRFIFPGTFPDA